MNSRELYLATVCVDVEGTGWVDHFDETGSVTEDGSLVKRRPPLPSPEDVTPDWLFSSPASF